jgi:hypothetical protein
MLDRDAAFRRAEEYFMAAGGLKVTKALETKNYWIFFGGDEEGCEYGGYGIKINKESSRTEDFVLPDDENFRLLKEADIIDFGQKNNNK